MFRLGRYAICVGFAAVMLLGVVPANVSAEPSGWGVGVPISDPGPDAFAPDAGVDASGKVFAVWYQSDGVYDRIWASRYRPGSGWGPAAIIDTGGAHSWDPRIAVAPSGVAMMVWTRQGGARQEVWASRYVEGSGWSSPSPIDAGPGNSVSPQIVIDGGGDAVAVWESRTGNSGEIWASNYTIGGGWSNATRLTPAPVEFYGLRLVGDSRGNATSVWTTVDAAGSGNPFGRVWATRFAHDVGWAVPDLLSPPTTPGWHGDIAMDENGSAIAVWTESQGGGLETVWARRYVDGVGWGGRAHIGKNATDADLRENQTFEDNNPRVAISASGDASVVWYRALHQALDWFSPYVWTTRYTVASGWEAPTRISDQGAIFYGGEPKLAADRSGNVIAGWVTDVQGDVRAARYVAGAGWGSPEVVGSGAVPPAPYGRSSYEREGLRLLYDRRGNAVAVWQQRVGSRNEIWTNRFAEATGGHGLIIDSPNFSLTKNPIVTLSGSADPQATVTVDGFPVPLSPTGTFSYTAALPQGPHTFVVIARVVGGNVSVASRTVTVDYRPPIVAITSPVDKTETHSGVATVSGTTEPGSTVVANGILAAVSGDGGFGVQLPLSEGANTIVVTATDAAGNNQTATVHVTYVRPDSGLAAELAQSRAIIAILGAVEAIFAAFAVVLLRRQTRERGRKQAGGDHSLPSEAVRESLRRGPAPTKTNRNSIDPGARWVNGGPVKLTTKERVLLHLLSYAKYVDAAEVPSDVTLLGISRCAMVDPRHFAQYTHPLVRDGLIRERTAHVKGVVQRRKVYVLTEEGRVKATGIRERIKTTTVAVRDSAGVRDARMADVLAQLRGATVLDVLRAANHEGVIDLESPSIPG